MSSVWIVVSKHLLVYIVILFHCYALLGDPGMWQYHYYLFYVVNLKKGLLSFNSKGSYKYLLRKENSLPESLLVSIVNPFSPVYDM
jgi:hypothetical protein